MFDKLVSTCKIPDGFGFRAKVLYESLDGKALESGREMDLRYVPDDVNFEGREVKDQCSKPPGAGYAPSVALLRSSPLETTSKLQNLEWDVTDPSRLEVTMKKFSKDELNELDFKAYLASSSDESESEFDAEDAKSKYRDLITSINSDLGYGEQSSDDEDMGEMEVTFTPGLSEKASELVQRFQDKKVGKDTEKTIFDKYVEKRAAKKKEHKEKSKLIKEGKFNDEDEALENDVNDGSDGEREDSELNDEEAQGNESEGEMEYEVVPEEEFEQDRSMDELAELMGNEDEEKESGPKQKTSRAEKKKEKRKKNDLEKKEKKRKDPQVDQKEKADLDLLVFDPTKEEEKELLSDEEDREQYKGMSKKKAKKQMKAKEEAEDKVISQKIVKDERFSKLIDDPRFSRDPTNVNYNPSASANVLIRQERHKRDDKDGDDIGQKRKETQSAVQNADEASSLRNMVQKIKGRMAQPAPSAHAKSTIKDPLRVDRVGRSEKQKKKDVKPTPKATDGHKRKSPNK